MQREETARWHIFLQQRSGICKEYDIFESTADKRYRTIASNQLCHNSIEEHIIFLLAAANTTPTYICITHYSLLLHSACYRSRKTVRI